MGDPFVGKQLSEIPFEVTSQLLEDYKNGLELDISKSTHVPSMIATDADNSYFREIAYDYQSGHLWMRQEWELFEPLSQEKSYRVSGAIDEIYQRRNRNVVKYRVDITDTERDQCAVRSYHHQSFLREKLVTDNVEFRDPGKKPGAKNFLLPEGKRFGGNTHTITEEMCGIYFHGNANYHTDKRAANELGFEEIVVGGRMTMAYVGNSLEQYFGTNWWKSGQLDLKFTNPVWCDDTITVSGIELANQPDPDRTAAFVWVEKEDGTTVIVANASVASNYTG